MILISVALIIFWLAIIWLILIYNSLIKSKNLIDNAWAQIDVQLKRRHDLIPNLLETTKGYMAHESSTLENVIKARATAIEAGTISEKAVAENSLGKALGRLMMVTEGYPELQANKNFLALQEELTSTENRIAFARQAYNDEVLFFNNKLQMFPSNIIADMLSFTAKPYLEIENKQEREAPKISF